MNSHLTHQQICDLLIDSKPDAASAAHLASCPACNAEFSTLSASLTNFRHASVQFAERAIDQRGAAHRPLLLPAKRTRRFLAVPAYVAAAAALALAIIIPMRSGSTAQPAGQPVVTATAVAPVESDDALFDEINRDIAASVPSPMEPLANPTGNAARRSAR